MKKAVLLFLGFFLFVQGFSKELKYENFIYDPLIETVLLSTNTAVYNPVAVMDLGQIEGLRLKFDRLEATNEFYQYTFIHCTSDWKPSNLQKTEYLEGATMGEISDYTFSSNTFQQYVQYKMVFPTQDMNLVVSGNYLLVVYKNFDESDIVLTRRFMVLEKKTNIVGDVKPATLPADRFYKQEVDFEVDYENYLIQNPFQDVNAIVLQNNSWNNAIYNLKPAFVNNNKLIFNYEDQNVIEGTSEFRFFDIRSLRAFSQNVQKKFTDSIINVVLKPQEVAAHLNYTNSIDFNGQRVVQNVDGGDVTENGDYTLVHFTLKSPNEISVGDVYVYGELSDWRMDDKFKMTYVPEKDIYYLAVKLKQSYYNYHFVVKRHDNQEIEYRFTEGNHSETENNYMVLLYHRDAFYGYDRLVGLKTMNSNSARD